MAIPNLAERSNHDRNSALCALIREATPRGSGSLRSGDLGNRQTVADYTRQNTWRYTHMYGAKHVAGWSFVRDRLGWADEPSRPWGAGRALLCATGWTDDAGPRTIRTFDVLDWSPVSSRAGRASRTEPGASDRGRVLSHDDAPGAAGPRSLGLRALRADDAADTVLMP